MPAVRDFRRTSSREPTAPENCRSIPEATGPEPGVGSALEPVQAPAGRAVDEDNDAGAPAPPTYRPDTRDELASASAAGTALEAAARELGGGDLLLSDLRFVYVLLNEARYRAMARLFGVSRDQTNLVSLVVLILLTEKLRSSLERLSAGRPTRVDGLITGALAREALSGVAGPLSRKDPLYGTLLLIAFLTSGAHPRVRRAMHSFRTGARRAGVGFHHRYGWLIDPGHLRQRRAQRRA